MLWLCQGKIGGALWLARTHLLCAEQLTYICWSKFCTCLGLHGKCHSEDQNSRKFTNTGFMWQKRRPMRLTLIGLQVFVRYGVVNVAHTETD